MTAAWLEERRKGIGASDVGAILGISPYQTPLGLYLEKRGELEGTRETDETAFGHRFEAAVLDEFEARTGKKLWRTKEIIFRHPLFDFICCTPDALIESDTVEDTIEAVVEAKTSMSFHRSQWEDGPPLWIEAQVQHQMLVTRATMAYVPTFFDDRHFEIFEIPRDEDLIGDLIEIESEFWERVQSGTPPEVTSQDTEILRRWFPSAIESAVDLELAHLEMIKRCVELGPIIKSYEDELSYLKAQLMKALGENEAGLFDGEKVVTWKEQGRTDIDRKALKEAEPEIFERYKTESRFRVMRFHWRQND